MDYILSFTLRNLHFLSASLSRSDMPERDIGVGGVSVRPSVRLSHAGIDL